MAQSISTGNTVQQSGIYKCKNCRKCMKLGCPAIEMADGKPVIIKSSCVGCGLCKTVCPFDAIEEGVK